MNANRKFIVALLATGALIERHHLTTIDDPAQRPPDQRNRRAKAAVDGKPHGGHPGTKAKDRHQIGQQLQDMQLAPRALWIIGGHGHSTRAMRCGMS